LNTRTPKGKDNTLPKSRVLLGWPGFAPNANFNQFGSFKKSY